MSAHLSQLLAGLYELQATGLVDLRFSETRAGARGEHLLCADVTTATGSTSRRVCFDMRDGAAIDREALEHSDVYFKRSYVLSELRQLPGESRVKVQPYGLNYACSADSQLRNPTFATQLFVQERAVGREDRSLRAIRRLIGHPVRWFSGRSIEVTASSPLRYPAFEASADAEVERGVIFLTRLWRPSEKACAEAESRRQLNQNRIDIIRTLRQRLGDRFLGGVERDAFSEVECPDCIIDVGTVKTSYVKLMKAHLIGIATTGLHGSTGWKMAEYVAASRCIVSQPLQSEVPGSFTKDRNYLEFDTPAECADACERLLDDPTLARDFRRRNESYYQRELKPPAMMLKRLQTAMASEPG